MAIEDYIQRSQVEITGHAPSRVRTMLQTVGNQLQASRSANRVFAFVGGKVASADQLLEEIGEALAEYQRLDDLLMQEQAQRQRIAARMSTFVTFYSHVRQQIRAYEAKPRRRLTAKQRVVAAAELRGTRQLRKTMGKRQKKALKA